MNTEKLKNTIEKIQTITKKIQNDFFFHEQVEKIKYPNFFEIRITSSSSIFIDKDINNFDKIKSGILNRKSLILSDEDKSYLSDFPNIYICKNKNTMTQSKPKEEETINFIAQKPKTNLDRVILPLKVKEDIEIALNLIKHQTLIYDDWGFSEVDSKPKLILNFYGPPGTGKTMVSHAIADKLNKKILAVNYAEIESKYVGDAPKNLFKAFDTASKEKAVLFFDEADSFLGKRIESVSSSSDQAINSLRSQMLILLEDFDGVVIFATNLAKNYDKAFESRILKHIHFDLPDKEGREKIIKITIPSKAPFVEDINIDEMCKSLAELSEGFSGREIKNAVLESLTIGAESNEQILTEENFKKGFISTSEKIKKLEAERKAKAPINDEVKKKIEEKIKNKLSAENKTELVETKDESNSIKK